MHKFLIFPTAILLLAGAWLLLRQAQNQTTYLGVPSVSCIDSTKLVAQNFSFTLRITVGGEPYPLNSSIGHDPGTCPRVIHTDDTSGKVFVQSNDAGKVYTLQDFFEVWQQQFSQNVIMGHEVGKGQTIKVRVNGSPVATVEDTPLRAHDVIEIIAQ